MSKKSLLSVLTAIVVSIGVLNGISKNQSSSGVNLQQLCVASNEYNPNSQGASRGERVFMGVSEAVIGFGIGFINPVAGLAYAL